jgi:hypothetical protein
MMQDRSSVKVINIFKQGDKNGKKNYSQYKASDQGR